jgi:F-type H+-transporting ATPase subunit b
MDLNATLIVQSIAFFLFVWFTMKFVFPPITKAMKDRQARIAEGLAAADKGSKSLQEASQKGEAELKAARAQAQEIVAAANKQASQLVEKAKADAEEQKARIVAAGHSEAGHSEVERELAQARDALRKQVGELAVAGASAILKREIDTRAHAAVLSELAAQI